MTLRTGNWPQQAESGESATANAVGRAKSSWRFGVLRHLRPPIPTAEGAHAPHLSGVPESIGPQAGDSVVDFRASVVNPPPIPPIWLGEGAG